MSQIGIVSGFTPASINPPKPGQYIATTTHKEHGGREVWAIWQGQHWITAPGREVEAWALPRQPKRNGYTVAEDMTIFRLAGKKPADQIAAEIGRSPASVKVRGHLLGLSLAVNYGYNHWSGTDERYLIELFKDGMKPGRIAIKLERTKASVNSKIEAFRKLGVLPRKRKA